MGSEREKSNKGLKGGSPVDAVASQRCTSPTKCLRRVQSSRCAGEAVPGQAAARGKNKIKKKINEKRGKSRIAAGRAGCCRAGAACSAGSGRAVQLRAVAALGFLAGHTPMGAGAEESSAPCWMPG